MRSRLWQRVVSLRESSSTPRISNSRSIVAVPTSSSNFTRPFQTPLTSSASGQNPRQVEDATAFATSYEREHGQLENGRQEKPDNYRWTVGTYQQSRCVNQQSPGSEHPQYMNAVQLPRNLDDGQNHGYSNVGNYQQYSSAGQYQQNPIAGQYHQNRIAGQYWQDSNTVVNNPNSADIQNRMHASPISTNSEPDRVPTEASNGSSYFDTLEKLDSFCKEGKVKDAMQVLELLEKQNVSVNMSQYLQLVQACGDAKALEEAKAVHKHIMTSQPGLQVSTNNRILEMYLKCGSIENAFNVFHTMPGHNLTSWDTMITSLAKSGLGEDALDLFSQFKKAGFRPDGQIFIGVFTACGVLGDVNEGMLHFESMRKDYDIIPSMEHYVSIVDMLASPGYLEEALEFIEKMPMEPNADIWETLMNLCRVHGHLELGDRCAELVEQLDPLSLNEQSKSGLVPIKASDLTKEKETQKLDSHDPLRIKTNIHSYQAGDTSRPENDEIYTLLKSLKVQMKEAGYFPATKSCLHDVDEESKEEALHSHSERLAVTHGLISSHARATIRVIKNLRVCSDCHAALKIISKIVGRELVMRDTKRFHHFKDGSCSCRDFW
ncbi:pentatricopeptide repeat-containing protein At4g32450, mitochondrial-like isoform X2 [Tripterygium wilfordii]|uniref:pentatricopeptide repeat-containing protein At4g32450, mitochondrial-like isoform X2 n=1 Tax=Tripterygium wilfordii TaxID=458696 RepID=UPI0018F855FD|nr:pentatricopeptide repeat-containing protein At4g32450, mitochondrial-like isoform X2 [Tripterygium wilfordii]